METFWPRPDDEQDDDAVMMLWRLDGEARARCRASELDPVVQ